MHFTVCVAVLKKLKLALSIAALCLWFAMVYIFKLQVGHTVIRVIQCAEQDSLVVNQ